MANIKFEFTKRRIVLYMIFVMRLYIGRSNDIPR